MTPKFTLEYSFSNTGLAYANIERGFKSGIISVGSPNPPANPEYVWNYELGLKSRLFENRLRFSAAAFFYNYKDLQVSQVVQLSTITTNAAKSHIKGLDLELDGNITPRLSVALFASYLDAKFLDFVTGESNRPQLGDQNLKGNTLPNSPKFTVRLSPSYTLPVGPTSSLTFRADASWVDDVYFEGFNNADAFQKAHSMLNANIRFETGEHGWSAELWGRNLGNKAIKANSIVASALWGFPEVGSLNPPRTYGVTFGYSF